MASRRRSCDLGAGHHGADHDRLHVESLELWRGVTNDAERKTLRRYEALLPDYQISVEVWERVIGLADRGRNAGVSVPLADLVIFACAKIHGLEIAHDDSHFDELAKLEA